MRLVSVDWSGPGWFLSSWLRVGDKELCEDLFCTAAGFSISIWHRLEKPVNIRSTGQANRGLAARGLGISGLVCAVFVIARPHVSGGSGTVYRRAGLAELGASHLVSLSIMDTLGLAVGALVPSVT